jgi:hypothetical protein
LKEKSNFLERRKKIQNFLLRNKKGNTFFKLNTRRNCAIDRNLHCVQISCKEGHWGCYICTCNWFARCYVCTYTCLFAKAHWSSVVLLKILWQDFFRKSNINPPIVLSNPRIICLQPFSLSEMLLALFGFTFITISLSQWHQYSHSSL